MFSFFCAKQKGTSLLQGLQQLFKQLQERGLQLLEQFFEQLQWQLAEQLLFKLLQRKIFI